MAYRRFIQGRYGEPAASLCCAFERFSIVGDYRMPTDVSGMSVGTLIEMLALPADAIPLDLRIMSEACDSGSAPTFSLKVGYMTGDYLSDADGRDVPNADFFSAATIVRSGGTVSTSNIASLLDSPATVDRAIGIKVVAAPATIVPGALVRLVLDCVAKPRGITSVTPS